MGDDYKQESKAPFNMAIATLMSLRYTLDRIRDIEGRIDYPASERQRIKIELVKRFFVDSSPLLGEDGSNKYKYVLDFKPMQVIKVNKIGEQKKVTIYSMELNKKLDESLLEIQIELQKSKYFMPPSDDLGTSVGRMS